MEGYPSNIFRGKNLNNFWLYFIPSIYFFKSRLNNLQALLYHSWHEWIAGIFTIMYFRNGFLFDSIWDYLIGFYTFIALYEIGYLVNDYYSVKQEEKPRKRVEELEIANNIELLSLLIVRFLFFIIMIVFTEIGHLSYLIFCLLMMIVFGLHNFIQEIEVKFVTFLSLSLFRFILPVFPFVRADDMRLIIPPVLVCYSLYRTINYLDSKDLLVLKNKRQGWFKLSFYLLILPLTIVFTVIYENPYALLLNFFYMFFWLVYFVKERRTQ